MDSAGLMEQAAQQLVSVIANRNRLMRNRNNKQAELRSLRKRMGRIHALASKGGVSQEELLRVLSDDD